MRKSIALSLICFACLLAAPFACASGISLFMGTNQITSLPEPMTVGSGILVPVGLIPYVGGEVISISSKSVRFRTAEYEVVVNGGESMATVNGKARSMGAEAVSDKGTLYLPLGFLSDILSLRVSWDQSSAAIRLNSRPNSPIPAAKPLVAVQAPLPTAPVPSPPPVPPAAPAAPKQLAATPAPSVPVTTPLPPGARVWPGEGTNSIVMTANADNGASSFTLMGVAMAAVSVSFVPAPNRLVIDIDGYLPPANLAPWQLDHAVVNQVRVAPYKGKGRIVLDLAEPTGYQIDEVSEGVRISLNRVIHNVIFTPLPDGGQLNLDLPSETTYTMFRLSGPDRLVLDFAGTTLGGGARNIPVNSGSIKAVRVSQFNTTTTRVVFDLSGNVADPVRVPANTMQLVLNTALPALLQGSHIVVDAGHGGFDPGAKGRTLGIAESDVNLDIAKQVATLLQQQKAEVTLTRADNSHVFLADRPNLAANAKPDVFISIHANSTTLEHSPSGTETLYWNTRDGSIELAQFIQEELVAALGTVNRGVKQQNLLVLRESSVPAVLVEVGFLSHPEEEAHLADPDFRRRAAEGIVNGLIRYLNQNTTQKEPPATANPQELHQIPENNN